MRLAYFPDLPNQQRLEARGTSSMRVTVLVPTYQRVAHLKHCLEGLRVQRRMADEILIVVRNSDKATQAFLNPLRGTMPLRMIEVHEGGQVASLNAGLDEAKGEIVMITDDDAIPREDWIERAEKRFATDPCLGGLGGRDIVHEGGAILGGSCKIVGKIQWFGRIVGNHHLQYPSPLSADILKGANMCYRSSAIGALRFDRNLRGIGAQIGNDMAFSLAVKRRGWRLLYDPCIIVDHYPATRLDDEQRDTLELSAVENLAFNIWWTLKVHMARGYRRIHALLWERWIGTHGRPGILRELLACMHGDKQRQLIAAGARRGRRQAAIAYVALHVIHPRSRE